MKRKLENYLHLYLPMGRKPIEVRLPNNDMAQFLGVHTNDGRIYCQLLFKGDDMNYLASSVKPILRPLSDMKRSEAEYFAWLCMDSRHHFDKDSRVDQDEIDIELVPNDNGLMLDNDVEIYIGVTCRCFEGCVIIRKDGSICIEDEDGRKQEPVEEVAEKIRWLLSKRFDLFNLIKSGLAIDSTSQKSTT